MAQNSILHPACRLSVRAVAGGVFVTLSIFLTLLALIAGFHVWNFDLSELPTLTMGFWISVFFAWCFAVFSGGLVSSLSLLPRGALNGILNAVATWAASCVFITTVLVLFTSETFNFTRDQYSEGGPFWLVFFGNTAAFGMSILAGRISAWRADAVSSEQEDVGELSDRNAA